MTETSWCIRVRIVQAPSYLCLPPPLFNTPSLLLFFFSHTHVVLDFSSLISVMMISDLIVFNKTFDDFF